MIAQMGSERKCPPRHTYHRGAISRIEKASSEHQTALEHAKDVCGFMEDGRDRSYYTEREILLPHFGREERLPSPPFFYI